MLKTEPLGCGLGRPIYRRQVLLTDFLIRKKNIAIVKLATERGADLRNITVWGRPKFSVFKNRNNPIVLSDERVPRNLSTTSVYS